MRDQQTYGTLPPTRPDLLLYVKENVDRELEKVDKEIVEAEKRVTILVQRRAKLRMLKAAQDNITKIYDTPS